MENKEVKHTIIKVGQSSFEFGPAKKRHKIYYEDGADLQSKLRQLVLTLETERETISFLTGENE
jgi:hypothetical protein